MRTLTGTITSGVGDAANWPLEQIREITGRAGLKAGTLNVKLEEPHFVRRDFMLPAALRRDGRREDLYFEECLLLVSQKIVPALIARTSTNYHGCAVLEVMAEEHIRNMYGLRDNDIIQVQVRTDDEENLV